MDRAYFASSLLIFRQMTCLLRSILAIPLLSLPAAEEMQKRGRDFPFPIHSLELAKMAAVLNA